MKKISILLILCMIISLLPALSVSAAGEYYLKGLYEGETVVIQQEPTKTVYVVDAAAATTAEPASGAYKMNINPTNVDRVVFTFNDNDPETIYGTIFSYTMEFDSIGAQTLKYDVYKKGNSTDVPDETETITFKTVAGTLNEASTDGVIDFESGTAADLAKLIVANDGTTYTDKYITFSVADWNGSKAFKVSTDSSTKSSFMQLISAPTDTGHKVHYYDFDMSMNGAYSVVMYIAGAGYTSSSSRDQLFRNRSFTKHSSNYTTVPVRMVLDYNYEEGGAPTAAIYFDGIEWGRIKLANAITGTQDPVPSLYIQCRSLSAYIDNFSYAVYDVKEAPSFTGASIPGGDKPVTVGLGEVRFAGDTYLVDDPTEFVTLSERANDSDGDFVASDAPYFAVVDEESGELVVVFENDLAEGTTYKIDISGVPADKYFNYSDYSFTFRTLNPGENPLPEVALVSPIEGTRYFPNESKITLSASAIDSLDGYIAKVEFYADGVKVGEATEGVDDVYTFEWVLDDSFDQIEPIAITAKAIDNEGGDTVSSAVNVTIRSKELPTVTITSPAQGTLYYSNIGGVSFDVKPTIEFKKEDTDGTINYVDLYVDGVKKELDVSAESYTLTEDLAVGEHTIIVEVMDNDNQSAFDSVEVLVEELGKAGYILNEDYTSEDLVSKWHKTGAAEYAFVEGEGVVISKPEGSTTVTGTAQRTIERNLKDTEFIADVKLSFKDTTTKRVVKLGDAEIATFTEGGKITFGGANKGTYQEGEIYNITAVVAPAEGKVYAIVNGTQIGSAAATYTVNPRIGVTHEGAGETVIISASASLVGAAVAPTVVVNGLEITVGFAAGVDEATLDGNVMLVDSQGNAVDLKYANGVFTVNEVLKYTETYKVRVLDNVRDINGMGYNGAYETAFTVPEPSTVVADVSGSVSGTTATLSVDFVGADETKPVILVCAAYKDNKMVAYDTKELTSNAAAEGVTLDLTGIVEGAVVEAFVVDTSLNSVSDKILVIE